MKHQRSVWILVLLGIAAHPLPLSAAGLAGSEWRPLQIAGYNVPEKAELFVRFEGKDKVVGHGGCNQFFGGFELSGDRIKIGPLASTRKACAQDVMQLEDRFMAALARAEHVERDGIRLVLAGKGGEVLVKLRQTDFD